MASSFNSGGAFDTILPSASTFVASSSATKLMPYDVFINHCGQDVKHKLASRIYNSLNDTGLRVFLDKDELKLGDLLPKALEEAMASASIYIAIFSEHYARSPWCLAELVFMVKTRKKIIPVFYHVKPSELRWTGGGKGKYADAFSEHENKNRYTAEVLQGWKQALQEVSCCIGGIINNIEDEQRVVKNVVNRVMEEMKVVPLEVAKHPVGLDKAVQNFDMIARQLAGPIQIIGIWGMGGAGKTTLATELYNRKCWTKDKSSFLFDLRDAAVKGLLHEKQKRLLKDLDFKDDVFDNVNAGKQILKSRLRSVRVLIVLDDVDHTEQLEALLPAKETLGQGSLIIVTTREKNVLTSWGISTIYKMTALEASHAKQLFCWHAFLQSSPLSGFEDLVEKFLTACHGLPLSLKVLGGQLYGKSDKDYWQLTFTKFSRIPHEDINERLKVSYDVLNDEEKEMFLDTACFFIGHRKSVAIAVWDASEWDGLLGWETLFNKCLVEVGEDGFIRMHDHLRDLGREIAKRQSPYRLWSPQQTIQISPQQEAIPIRGMANAIVTNWYLWSGEIVIHTNQGERSLAPRSLGLKIFVGERNFLSQIDSELSRELIWLQCNPFGYKILPSWLSLKKLRILELFHSPSLEDLWERDADAPLQLRELVIRECNRLRGFPRSIGRLENLKKIVIGLSDSLSGLPEEFCHLQSLEQLEMERCTNLSALPSNFGKLTNLQHLNLNGCIKLKTLPYSFKKLTLLEYLSLNDCRELIIKSELHVLENMSKLRYLNLNWCRKLEELRLPEVASLTELYLDGTSLKELPGNIFRLTKLTELVIGSEFLTTLPNSLGNLSSLTRLTIQSCKKLESLPDSLEHLNFFEDLNISMSGVKCLPKSFIHLQRLKICKTPINELSFGSGCMLKTIDLWDTKVSKISISGDCCPFLETLNLYGNKDLRDLETLPVTLKTIDVRKCHKLEKIEGLGNLRSLETLRIHDCPELDGLPSLSELTSLKEFDLQKCHKLEKIEGLGNLRSLETLRIHDCPELDGLPSLSELTSLKEFDLQKCHKLGKIEGLGNLRSLETLRIDDCPELDGLPSFTELSPLKEFNLQKCHKLEKIEGLERLRSLERLEVHTRWNAPCIVSLEQCERLKRLVVVANDRSAIEPFINNIQKWPREVIICTRAVFDVGSLKNSFEELPNVSVLHYSDGVDAEWGLELRRPESSANANAILICYIIDCVYPDLEVHINLYLDSLFRTDMGKGKWVWMGVFTQASFWLGSDEDEINASSEGQWVEGGVKVEEAWLVKGEEGSIVEAFHQLWASVINAPLLYSFI